MKAEEIVLTGQCRLLLADMQWYTVERGSLVVEHGTARWRDPAYYGNVERYCVPVEYVWAQAMEVESET